MVIIGEDVSTAVNKRHLALVLEALANENRLELLEQLRLPRAVSEIELTPGQAREGENSERLISRQAVRAHVQKLMEIGVVLARRSRRGAATVDEHVLNHPRLFAILEDLRSLGALQSQGPLPPGADATLDGSVPAESLRLGSPRVMIVKGLHEGRAFALKPTEIDGEERGWIIGRKPGLAVPLDYDPYVSSQNSEITFDGVRWTLHDLRTSRNGTALNFAKLPKGETARLEHGDVIGVGRSLLLFRER